jgi:TP901 family phage tail tape measure protein
VGVGAEAFTVLAVLEARDMASEIYDKVQAKLGQFSETMKAAADSANVSGDKIDESFLKTASGADALSLATAKVEAASAKLDAANKAQADSEKALLDAQEQVRVAADGDTEAMTKQIAAADKLAASQKETAKATSGLKDAQASQEAITKAQTAATEESAAKSDSAGSKLGSVASTMGKVGLGVALAGGLLVKGAADFQSSTTVLETSGGETAAQLDTVRKGILSLSGSTGTALKPLTDGMYMIGSAGYTGGAGLKVLQSAAQGAKAENADLGTVSNALTTILKDYGVQVADNAKGQQASNAAMDQMIAVVSNGKTTTEQLAGSLSAVLPLASSVGLSFAQVGGAMATMTGQGMSAQQSAQNLNNVLVNLTGGNAVAAKEMQQLGLSTLDVRKALSDPSKGLTGALDMVTGAIQKNFSAGGQIVQSFQNSASAAQNAQQMIGAMPKSLQSLANSLLTGSINSQQFKTDLKGLDPVTAHMMTQFEGVANQTHEFNDALTKGTPAQQSAAQAMQKMLGGTTGLNVALMLTGKNSQTFKDNVQKVGEAAKGAGSSVDGWRQIQGNFNQKLAEAKQSLEATGISIGTALLPMVTKLAQDILAIIGPIESWIQGHQKLTLIIVGAVAGLGLLVGTINLAVKAYKAVSDAVSAVGKVLSKITDLFSGASDAQDANATSADGAAASQDGLATSQAATTTATEEQTIAADENAAGWLRSSLAAVGAAAKFLILQGAELAVTIATKTWTAAQWLFNAAMDANPIMLVVIAIAALAAGVIYAYTHFTAFRQIVDAVFSWLKGAVTDVIDFVRDHWQMIVEIITGPIVLVATLVEQHWDQIKAIFTRAVGDIISFLTYWFVGLPLKFASWLASTVAAVGRGVADLLVWWVELPGKIEGAIWGFFGGLADKFAGWIGDAATATLNKGADILQWFKDLPGKIKDALGDLSQTLWNAGVDLIKGFINGIGSMFDSVKNTLGNLASKLTDWKGPPAKDKILLTDNGKLVIQGLIAGFDQEIPAVQAKLQGLTANIQQTVTPTLPALPAAGPGASAGGGTVVNINLANAFNGANIMNDRDMDLFAQKISSAVAQHLPAGGLRVAM